MVNEVSGFLVALNEIEELSAALLNLIENPPPRQELSEGARHAAEKRLDFDRYSDQLVE